MCRQNTLAGQGRGEEQPSGRSRMGVVEGRVGAKQPAHEAGVVIHQVTTRLKIIDEVIP